MLALLAAGLAPVPDGGGAVARAAEPAAAGPPSAAVYPSAAAALEVVLASRPRVLAVGELHQTRATARVRSALARFTAELLPPLRAAGATHLVVETWRATGACGAAEKAAVAQVETTTERPRRTESEVVTLLRQAKAAGIEPGILEIGCRDYKAMMTGQGVDFDRLLRLTRDQLLFQLRAALARPNSRLVVSYGGALHNDRYPKGELAPYSFGPALASSAGERYVALDLYVPELLERSPRARAEPWYPIYRRARRPGAVTLVRLGEGAFALVFPRSRPAPARPRPGGAGRRTRPARLTRMERRARRGSLRRS